MSKSIANTLGIALILAIGLAVWGASSLNQHIILAADSIAQTGAQAQQTLAAINKPKYGTIAEIDETLFQSRIAIGAVNEVAIHEQHQLSSYDPIPSQISALLESGTGTLKAGTGTLNAATKTVDNAGTVLSSIRRTTDELPPLITASTASVNDFDKLLKDKAIMQTIDNVQGITNHIDSITGDTAKVTAHWEPIIDKKCGKGCQVWNVIKAVAPIAAAAHY